MPYLIDGYNLLFAVGRLTARSGKGALEASRKWLLVEVVRWHGPEASAVTVVFDASKAPPGRSGEREHGGVRVLFAQGQTADDVIEELIRDESSPRSLTVVSDDNRIKNAARRRGCDVLGCLDYVERWHQPRPVSESVPQPESAKPDDSTEEEKRRWLDAFKDIDDPLYRDPF
jgi:predicted RNA-binding protein with PIN domain